jgi:hypothetical protein
MSGDRAHRLARSFIISTIPLELLYDGITTELDPSLCREGRSGTDRAGGTFEHRHGAPQPTAARKLVSCGASFSWSTPRQRAHRFTARAVFADQVFRHVCFFLLCRLGLPVLWHVA